jgi:hypothetical protein
MFERAMEEQVIDIRGHTSKEIILNGYVITIRNCGPMKTYLAVKIESTNDE